MPAPVRLSRCKSVLFCACLSLCAWTVAQSRPEEWKCNAADLLAANGRIAGGLGGKLLLAVCCHMSIMDFLNVEYALQTLDQRQHD